jgi:phospholipase/carboxylesterase
MTDRLKERPMTTMTELSHLHRFLPATEAGRPPLLLLHGTGGDENDLLPLGRVVAPGSALLSPRGKVLEGGMPRFFRRLAEGVFDEADIRRRADELAAFIAEAREAYGLAAPVALGFSNGANIAAALLALRPEALAGAALLRAMVPLSDAPAAALAGKPVLILSGASDPMVPAENATRLAGALRTAGALVDHRVLPVGHALAQADITLTKAWLAESWRLEPPETMRVTSR